MSISPASSSQSDLCIFTMEDLLDAFRWWLIYFCDFFIATVERHVHRSPYPCPWIQMAQQPGEPCTPSSPWRPVSSRQAPMSRCQLGGLEEDGVGLQPQEGPKPHTKFSHGRARVLSWPGGIPPTATFTPHSVVCTWTQLTFCFGQNAGLPGGEVTAPVHRHRGAKELPGFSWWQ